MFILWTTHPGWHAIGWTMIHFLWNGTSIGLVAFVGRIALHRDRSLMRNMSLAGGAMEYATTAENHQSTTDRGELP